MDDFGVTLLRDVRVFVLSLVYALVGLTVLSLAYTIFDVLTPHDLGQEIFERKNTAAAVMTGFFILALALVIAAAIHG
ncbi:MAG: DUF350 domain-containing protein [Dehalococcoidia bacterium]|nr:DUF350 domain-containing protein [Dehalococcoidia bacterium]